MATLVQNAEGVSKETALRTEYSFFGPTGVALHTSRIEHKNKPIIQVFPYNYNERNGITPKKISEIEFRGWSSFGSLPKLLKPGKNISVGHRDLKPVMRLIYTKYPKLKKLVISQESGRTRLSATSAVFSFSDLEKICRTISKEISHHEIRRKTAALSGLAHISKQFSPRLTKLPKGGIANFLALYDDHLSLSEEDVTTILSVVPRIPFGNVSITQNFIETKNQINVAFLDDIIERFEALMEVKVDNEKAWQSFFGEHGWLLASVFPYQVILYQQEAYVGGKTIENQEGRVVDFLFQNGFRDNYALLEIKTHNKLLVKTSAYRAPSAFAQHDDCSGAIAQCLDQKSTFLREMGSKYRILDPKVVLIIGRKGGMTDNQTDAFELMRNNQKNVDIVTFDELLEKLSGLRSILQT